MSEKEKELTEIQKDCIKFNNNPVVRGFTWADSTTYSRNDVNKYPRSFSLNLGTIYITIMCQHRYCPNEWVFTCHQLNVEASKLKVATAYEAADKAFAICKNRVESMLNEFKKTKTKPNA